MNGRVPSYSQGFARYAAESAYPEQWRGLILAIAPHLGPTGVDIQDWSGRGNHLTLSGFTLASAYIQAADALMNPITALDFDGTNDKIVTPLLLEGASEFTICFLWQREAGVGAKALYSAWDQGVYFQNTITYHGDFNWNWYTRDSSTGNTGGRNNDLAYLTPPFGEWHHYCFRYSVSDSDKSIWEDGVLGNSTSTSIDTLTTDWDGETIGFDDAANLYSNARIADFRIYNYALSPAEIAALSKDIRAMYVPRWWTHGKAAAAAAFALPVLSQQDIHSTIFGGQVINGG